METKKSTRANLERDRPTYLLLGLVVVLAVFFVILEWRSEEYLSPDWEGFSQLYIEEELISFETLSDTENTATKEIVVEEEPNLASEDFNVVEKPIEVSILPDSALIVIPEEEVASELSLLKESEIEDMIHTQAEIMPEFPGGYNALIRFLFNNIEYPDIASKQKIEGRVWCSFVVNKDGSLSDIKIEESVYIFLDEEALRVLNNMPDWIPGTIDNNAVRTKVYLPIVFKL